MTNFWIHDPNFIHKELHQESIDGQPVDETRKIFTITSFFKSMTQYSDKITIENKSQGMIRLSKIYTTNKLLYNMRVTEILDRTYLSIEYTQTQLELLDSKDYKISLL